MEFTKQFLAQTAFDYDMPIEQVEVIAEDSNSYQDFYFLLEEKLASNQ